MQLGGVQTHARSHATCRIDTLTNKPVTARYFVATLATLYDKQFISLTTHGLLKKVKSSQYSITERSQPAGDVSHKPDGRLPLHGRWTSLKTYSLLVLSAATKDNQELVHQDGTSMPGAAAPGKYPVNTQSQYLD